MSFAILGMGTAQPPTALTQDEAARVARALCAGSDEQAQTLHNLHRHTAITTRHLAFTRAEIDDVLHGTRTTASVFLPTGRPDDAGPTTQQRMERYAQEAVSLALAASRQALDESGLSPITITHLVTVSCTGFRAPGVDIRLMKALGLPATTQRTHVGFMGCHGALNGLRAAAAYAGADPAARVLLCAVELCGLHYHYGWDPKRMVANALFADGAAAVVGAAVEQAFWRVTGSGSCLFADSEWAMTWDIGDHGFDMTLSTKVPELIARNLRPWLEGWLADNNLRLGDVASWAVHPGGPRVLTAVEEALGLDTTATAVSLDVFASCGNMSSPTVLFILERLRAQNAPRPCVALAFGPGLVAEAALFD